MLSLIVFLPRPPAALALLGRAGAGRRAASSSGAWIGVSAPPTWLSSAAAWAGYDPRGRVRLDRGTVPWIPTAGVRYHVRAVDRAVPAADRDDRRAVPGRGKPWFAARRPAGSRATCACSCSCRPLSLGLFAALGT